MLRCGPPLFALRLEGPRRQTEPPSRYMRLALQLIADTVSVLLVLSSLPGVLPNSLTRARRDPTVPRAHSRPAKTE